MNTETKSKLGITPGNWRVAEGRPVVILSDSSVMMGAKVLSHKVAQVFQIGYETDRNARLIAEAGTVANETGLWPREMAEQRAELLEACKELLENATGPAMVYGDGRDNDGKKTGVEVMIQESVHIGSSKVENGTTSTAIRDRIDRRLKASSL